MFSAEGRDLARDRIVAWAHDDERVVAAAAVGSLAVGGGDRWSDVDLSFAVADDVRVVDVLEDWSARVADELQGLHLFDLTRGATIYRVFLLPDWLQVDLSFTPAASFGAAGPRWRLLFGRDVERPHAEPPPAEELFGYAVLYARHGYVCIERGRYQQAEQFVSGLRDYALALACRVRDLPAAHGRGLDDLPPDVLARFDDALVRAVTADELRRALRVAVDGLLAVSGELAGDLEPQLRELVRPQA